MKNFIPDAVNLRNLELINVPPVREMLDSAGDPLDGRDTTVAIFERGADFNIPELELRFGRNIAVDQFNFENNTRDVSANKDGRHGFLVTQLILSVAPPNRYLSLRNGI